MSAAAQTMREMNVTARLSAIVETLKKLSPFGRLSARLHIVIGLTSLVGSCTLVAVFLGVIPDSRANEHKSRVILAESVTTLGSALLRNGDLAGLRFSLEFIAESNRDIYAIQLLSRSGGKYRFLSTESEASENSGKKVITNDYSVPIILNNQHWGELTLQYVSAENLPLHKQYLKTTWAVIACLVLMCLPLFYLFLGKVLKELNPSSAVPSRVRSALDTIAESLLVLDIKGNIVLANAAFIELTGTAIEDLLGKPANALQWKDKSNFVWEDALKKNMSTRHEKVGFQNALGQQCTFIINCSPVITANNTVGGVLVSMDDITRLEEQEIVLRESMQLAEEANNAKSSFLSNISHEIRTPMTAILGFTEVMQRKKKQSEAERQEYLSTIAKSGEHLLNLINDILDLSKVESGAMDVEQLPCNCAGIAKDVINVLKSKADEKSISLNLQINTSLPDRIIADPSRLRQIMINLVGNAIKFTEQGSVTLAISTGIDSEAYFPVIHCDVVDSGIGMSEEQQAKIFDAFSQADTTIARRFGGTGLGLSISKQLTEAMNGELSVSSTQGVGSKFRVTLPFNTTDYQLLEPNDITALFDKSCAEDKIVWDIDPARILVVDDGAENRQLLNIVLGDSGLDVVLAENGQQGVDALFGQDPGCEFNLVLMDIQMPVMDGYQAARCMRAQGASIPIVALTANAMKGFEQTVMDAGFSHYMVKPINLDLLNELLASLLGGSKRVLSNESSEHTDINDPIIGKATSSDTINAEDGTETLEPLVSQLAIADERFISIVEDFRVSVGERLVEIESAIDMQAWKQIDDHAHWLKGSAGNVGLTPLFNASFALQTAVANKDIDSCGNLLKEIKNLHERIVADPASLNNSVEHDSLDRTTDMSVADDGMSEDMGPVFTSLPVNVAEFYDVVSLFMERLCEQMKTLREAVDKQDGKGVREVAHWLRGSGGNVGYEDYGAICNYLENTDVKELETMRLGLQKVEAYNKRVFAGWALTPAPGTNDGQTR